MQQAATGRLHSTQATAPRAATAATCDDRHRLHLGGGARDRVLSAPWNPRHRWTEASSTSSSSRASRSAKGWETVDTTRQWRIQRRLHATNDQAAVSAPTEEPRGTTRRRHSAAPLLPQGNQNQHSGPNVWAGRIVKGQAPVGPPPIGPRTQTSPEPNASRPHHHHIGRPHSPR